MTAALPDRAVVLLGEQEVGVLVKVGEHSRFEPSEEWAGQPAGERHVLGQQFEDDPYAAHVGRTRMGVPLWFEHLLPEADGPLRNAVARAVEVSPTRGYALLLHLGEDLPGAVRVRPTQGDVSFRTVARRVRESLGESPDSARPLRVSLAGVQFKISARLGKRGIAVPGWDEEADWIVKLADQAHTDLPAVEFITMSWAAASGLDVPEVRLEKTADIEGLELFREAAGEFAFAIARYDRPPTGRVHQEDFAQVLGLAAGDAKYDKTNLDSILNVVATLVPDDVDELLRRIVFCVLAGNDDAHAKNWSLWYPDAVRARLSPAYDLVSTLSFPQYAKNPMALKLAGARRFEDVDLARFRSLAVSTGLDPGHVENLVRGAVATQVHSWEAVRDRPELPRTMRDVVDLRLRDLKLAREIAQQ